MRLLRIGEEMRAQTEIVFDSLTTRMGRLHVAVSQHGLVLIGLGGLWIVFSTWPGALAKIPPEGTGPPSDPMPTNCRST